MNRLFCLALAALLSNCPAALHAQTPEESESKDFVFHTEVHLVNLSFLARDASGHLVHGLKQDDFKIMEDGIEQKPVFFARESQLPLTVGLLIDASNSQEKFLKQHNKDIHTFLSSVLGPKDQAFAICFGDHIRIVTDNTASPDEILAGLQRYDHGNRSFPELMADESREGGTALFDSIFATASMKLAKDQGRRRALILFTDGEENSSAHDEIETIAAAQDADVLVYAIRYTHNDHGRTTAANSHGKANLHHITDETGGTDFDGLTTDLSVAFASIAEELRSLYSVGYQSTDKVRDDRFRKVTILPNDNSLRISAKSGYYAH